MVMQFKVIVEKHSAIRFYIETFGNEVFEEGDVLEAFVAETGVSV